jgi:hypothetical protein
MPSGDPEKKYPAIQNCRSGENTLQTVLELKPSGSVGTLVDHVHNIAATTSAHANLTIGVAWGHALLTQAVEPFQRARPSNTPHHRRILIVLSSGVNDQSRYSPAAAKADKFKPNLRAAMACSSVKTKVKADDIPVEVYTVNLSFGSAGDDLLKACASDPANFYDTTSASDIPGIFSKFSQMVRQPRLTH